MALEPVSRRHRAHHLCSTAVQIKKQICEGKVTQYRNTNRIYVAP
jgi:hypothetical protein